MAALMSLTQYTARLGRSLSGVKATQAEAFMDDASALVRRIAGGALDEADSTSVPPEVLPVLFSMVNRGIHNPRGHGSERVADYQYSGGGNIYATPDEADQIREVVGRSRVRAVRNTAPIFEHLVLDVMNNPSYPS